MTERIQGRRSASALLACVVGLALPLALPVTAAGFPGDDNDKAATPAPSEMEQLKQMLLEQQKQINELRRMLLERGDFATTHPSIVPAPAPSVPAPAAAAEAASSAPPAPVKHDVGNSIGEVASTTAALPPPPPASAPLNPPSSSSSPAAGPPPQGDQTSPLQLKIGDAYITPVGFMDMTLVSRSTNPGSGIGTNFGSIPYGNTQAGSLTETRLSPQNSRIGARFDALYHDWKILGYWESDFLGQLGNPPNGGIAVSSNPYVFRLRLYWVDLTKGKFEFLAGQSWSLMTPNRKGVSPLPGDVFYSQDMDVNYQLGLTWARNPGYRIAFHPSDKVAFAVALENSEPYVGGANGGSAVTLPAAISTTATTGTTQGSVLGGQINNGSSVISSAALFPDVIAKLAFDPSSRVHFEIAGVGIADKIAYPTPAPVTYPTSTTYGGGGSVNANVEVFKNFRLIGTSFWSDGGGRYIFGEAPDFAIRANGTPSLIHSGAGTAGFEATAGKVLLFGYYGGVYVGRDMLLDTNGNKIGYGPISSDGQNRAIQEFTIGSNTTLMRDPKWGAVNLIFQYSYLERDPWLAAVGAPTNAHLSMGFFDVRYTLPGSAPTLGSPSK
jgi:hypothetical protein